MQRRSLVILVSALPVAYSSLKLKIKKKRGKEPDLMTGQCLFRLVVTYRRTNEQKILAG